MFAAFLAVYTTYDALRNRKIDNFRTNFSNMTNGRSIYSDLMAAAYRRRYAGKEVRASEGTYLLKPVAETGGPQWDGPFPLDELGVWTTGRKETFTKGVKGTSWHLPNMMSTYAYNAARYARKRIINKELYRIEVVESEGGRPCIRLGTSDYYSYYNTCEFQAFTSVASLNKEMEMRRRLGDGRLHRVADRSVIDIWDFENRCVAIGVCTLTVFYNVGRRGGPQLFLVHHRSDAVAEAAKAISMVPAGTLARNGPSEEGEGRPVSIGVNVLREFEEEVLGRDEVEFADEFTDPIPEGMSMLYLTMGFDPLTTKIEMVTLLSVDCCEPKVRQFISELVPGFPSEGGPIEDEEIRGLTKNRASSEGGIAVEPFDEKTLRRYERCSEGMPVFRECMRMVAENMDVIRETFKQPDLPL